MKNHTLFCPSSSHSTRAKLLTRQFALFLCLAFYACFLDFPVQADEPPSSKVRLKILFMQGYEATSYFRLTDGTQDGKKARALMEQAFRGHDVRFDTSNATRNQLIAMIQEADVLYLNVHAAAIEGMGQFIQVASSPDNMNITPKGNSALLATESGMHLKEKKAHG